MRLSQEVLEMASLNTTLHVSEGGCDVKASKHLASLLTTD
jgi:hypothetical protein